jgi:YD repeat-containing protein
VMELSVGMIPREMRLTNHSQLRYNTTMSDNKPIYEYASNRNLIHYKDIDGYEEWYEYDADGNMIHFKTSDGYESWSEYDANNNLIYYKNSDGYEYWQEFDSNDNRIHYKDSNGVEYWYDSNGNVIDKPTTEAYNINMNTTIDLPKPKFTADSLELFDHPNRDRIAQLMNTLIAEVVHRMYGTYHPVDVRISILESAIDKEFEKHPEIENAGGRDSEPRYAIECYLKRIVGGVHKIYGIKQYSDF